MKHDQASGEKYVYKCQWEDENNLPIIKKN